MADLRVLIKLHQHELDEKRRELKELYDKIEQIELEKQAILDKLEHEKQLITKSSNNVHFTYAKFQEKVEQDCIKFDRSKEAIEHEIYVVRDDMLDIFMEMKRYDMAQQERDKIEDAERKLRETKTIDEIAIEGFRRK